MLRKLAKLVTVSGDERCQSVLFRGEREAKGHAVATAKIFYEREGLHAWFLLVLKMRLDVLHLKGPMNHLLG